jgi:hexosaminidase
MKLKALIFLLMSSSVFAQSFIIPKPVSYEIGKGSFILDRNTSLIFSGSNSTAESMVNLFEVFLKEKGISIQKDLFSEKIIKITLLQQSEARISSNDEGYKLDESYNLDINKDQIDITCSTTGGLHNALQSLRQIVETKIMGGNGQKTAILEACSIRDKPRFGWRGLMLDVSRNFFTVAEVKAYIDLMALYKFNVLHWHLTDDEGWRLEIKSLPKLTEVGAWRVERNGRFGDGRAFPKPGEKASNGGFYTHEQVRDIVQYALNRNVQILPEIDIPGHSMAALAAYPELSTKKEPHFVNPGSKFSEWYGNGTFKMLIENTVNPADENVYTFVDKVMTEVASLFPFEYIHMGGDESYHGYWDADKKVKAFMKTNGIKDTHGLQSYFVSRVSKIVNAKKKKLIGWDEILEGGLVEGAAVMSWRGVKGGIEAAKKGHSVVMSPTTHAYIDYIQGDPSVENTIYASLNLSKTYSFEPVPEGVDAKYILGTQGNLWTEVIPSLPYAFYMTYPRAFAIAENGWVGANQKNYPEFLNRVENHIERFETKGISVAKTIFEPEVSVKKENGKTMISLSNDVKNAEIYFSVDNTYPVNFSKKYAGPFEKPEGNYNLRTQVFRNGKALGRELIIPAADLEKRAK